MKMGVTRHSVLMICVINIIFTNCHVDATFAPPTGSTPNAPGSSYKRAKTMTNWVYFRVPRIEALIIKLSTRSLHPGDMSCWKNLMTVTEFTSLFKIYFPTARKGATYSVIIFSDVEVFFVKYGIMAESIFRGIDGPDLTVKSMLVNFFGFKKVRIALFEENPQMPIASLDPTTLKIGVGLQAVETIFENTSGLAGKVCMELLADDYKVTQRPRTINHDYQKSVDTLGRGWFTPTQQT